VPEFIGDRFANSSGQSGLASRIPRAATCPYLSACRYVNFCCLMVMYPVVAWVLSISLPGSSNADLEKLLCLLVRLPAKYKGYMQ
jgi:hypothetical protein